MSTLLINGCSYTECWHPSDSFVRSLNCTNVINLGKGGTSFQRSCRSTIEWVAQNGNPSFIIIPITFSHRWELALNKKEDIIDGSWFPLQNSNFLSERYELEETTIKKLKKLVDEYYKIIPTIKTYWDKMFTEIIMFSGWLDSKNIPYLLFDMCNQFDKKHLKGYKGFEKIKLIEKNKKIIDLFKFCGNYYMWQSMNEENKKSIDPLMYHHYSNEYQKLENYLQNYLRHQQ
jgi:hypothetical protein